MSASKADWVAFLESLESEVLAVERAPQRRARPRRFVPPTDLGPLPRELAGRARAVLSTIDDVSELVREDMARTSEQLRALRRHDPRGPKPASSFDAHA